MYQVLLTALVVVAVVIITRLRRAPARGGRSHARGRDGPARSALVGYSLLVILIVAATSVFYLQWREANEIVSVRIVDTRSGERTSYQVYRKEIDGRSFYTVDGRYVSLSDADRMELVDP